MSDRGMKAAAAAHRAGQRTPRGLEQLIVEHMNFGKKRAGLNRTIFFALALAGEAGELCNVIKKKLRGDRKYKGKAGATLFAEHVDGETVDLGNYVYMMAAHREIPLTRRMLEKLLEVEARDDDWNRLPVKLYDSRCYAPKTARQVGKSKFLAAPYGKQSRQRKTKRRYPCHQLNKSQWCDRDGPGGFMGHTCGPHFNGTF